MDYLDSTFTTPGYYRIRYGNPEGAEGPFDSIMELASETDLYGFPNDGYIVHFDGSVLGNVPSLNPDDLLQMVCRHCDEVIYEDGTDTWCHYSDGCLLCDRSQSDRTEAEVDATMAGPTPEALDAYIDAMGLDPADYGLHV